MADSRQRTFDVVRATHPKNRLFAASVVKPPWLARAPRDKVWTPGPQLDQGREGACVGFGCWGEALSTPVRTRASVNPDLQAQHVYYEARRRDEWGGENYDGTSLTGGGNAMRALGYLDAFVWLHSVDEVARAVGWSGPVVVGIPWLSGMDSQDADGFFGTTGEVRGWHCVLLYGTQGYHRRSRWTARPHFLLRNSWGGEGNGRLDARALEEMFAVGADAWTARGRHARGRLGVVL